MHKVRGGDQAEQLLQGSVQLLCPLGSPSSSWKASPCPERCLPPIPIAGDARTAVLCFPLPPWASAPALLAQHGGALSWLWGFLAPGASGIPAIPVLLLESKPSCVTHTHIITAASLGSCSGIYCPVEEPAAPITLGFVARVKNSNWCQPEEKHPKLWANFH